MMKKHNSKKLGTAAVHLFFIIIFFPFAAFCHPGGLNSNGCHRNHKTGDYHCHGGGVPEPSRPNSRSESQRPAQGSLIVIPDRGHDTRQQQNAKVVGVTDGDTLKVIIGGKETKVRLYGIDAPESKQAFGQVSTTALKQITTGRNITIQVVDVDRYGRSVAIVYADGGNVNEALVSSGYSWVYQQYCDQSFCLDWIKKEQLARSYKKGLWNDSNPVPPWEWRHPNNTESIKMQRKNDNW